MLVVETVIVLRPVAVLVDSAVLGGALDPVVVNLGEDSERMIIELLSPDVVAAALDPVLVEPAAVSTGPVFVFVSVTVVEVSVFVTGGEVAIVIE